MKKIALILICFFIFIPAETFANSSEAFMSLPFGHTWTRTKIRMEKSGAQIISEKRGESLTAKAMFEGREALFIFNFTPKKGLSSKVVNISSYGKPDDDRNFYDTLRMAYESRFGIIKERPTVTSGTGIALRSHWAPDQYTDITLTYNPNTMRFTGDLVKDSPIRLSYITKKWSSK